MTGNRWNRQQSDENFEYCYYFSACNFYRDTCFVCYKCSNVFHSRSAWCCWILKRWWALWLEWSWSWQTAHFHCWKVCNAA